MTPYVILLLLTLVCAVTSIFPTARRPAITAIFILLAGFAGLRSEIGWDYDAYQYLYDEFTSHSLAEVFSPGQAVDLLGFEPGFSLLMWVTSSVGANYQLVCSILTVGFCLFAAYLLSPPQALPLFLVAYLWYGYYHNFSILRQGLATGIIFLALALFNNRRKLSTALYALASTIHLSAIALAPLLAACIIFSTRRVVLLTLILCWILSLTNFFSETLISLLLSIGRERWQILLEFGELTSKVGVSLILIEYTLLAASLTFIDSDKPAIRFARGVLVYRLLAYGFLNDISIAWERTNAFTDPMYALALAIILTTLIGKLCHTLWLFRVGLIVSVIALGFYVAFKYERMLSTEPRVAEERSHFERFIPYRSIFDE